jgi:hypothetical protein
MVKKTMNPQRSQKIKKGKELLHYTIFTPMVNKSYGSTKRQKNEKGQKSCSSIAQTSLSMQRNFFLHKSFLLGSSKHNAQQISPAMK